MVNDSKRPPVSNNNDDGSRVDVGGQEGRRGHYPTMGDLVLDVDSFLDSDDAAAEDIPPDENDPDDEEEEEEEEYTTQLPDETDDPDSTLTVIQPRQRRARSRNRDIVQQEPTGNASVSSALGSWMSSYARSTGFVEEAAAPTAKKLRNVASMDEAWLAVQGTAEGGEEFVVPEVVLVDAPECMGGGEDLIASVTSYGTLVGDDADSEAPSEKTALSSDHHASSEGPVPMSSYAQTIFNSVNLLMGIGILSLPFAFRITGWVIGIAFLVLCCTMTHHTAGLLALCLDFPKYMAGLAARKATTTTNAATEYTPLVSFPPLTRRPPATYGDIGELAYGEHGRNFISVLFCLELAAASVALIILASDSVTALFPALNPLLVKIAALVITMPLTYPTSLSWASYGSLIGLIALANLMIIVVWDGTTTTESPGSLLVPAQTHMWPERWELVPLAIGLIMASFSGHAVFPNIYRDMKEPKKYNSMLNASYIITFTVCLMLASAGYLMFGDFTMPELTQNLPLVPSYNKVLTHMTLFLTAINPLTKYPLSVNPINVQIEHTLHLLFPSLIPSPPHSLLLRLPIRTCTSLLILLIAITFPNFHSLMSLTGSLFACAVCVVFPSLCYLKLYGPALGMRAKCLEWAIVGVGVVCGSVGTYWACFMDV